jgi:hypothetical protein
MGVPAAAAEHEEEALPTAPQPPDPRTMDTALALTMLKLHRLPADQKGAGSPIMRRATREETDAAIVRKLKALRKRLERR